MNILYTITWPTSNTADLPRQFYEQLREAVARGTRFPFDCPYEVALMRASPTPDATPPSADWAVAVLAMRVTTTEVGAPQHTLPELENWFKQCVPGGLPPGSLIQPAVATHLKLASEMRPDYEVVANFGTFVGEPELETPPGRTNPPASQPVSVETPKVLSEPLPSTPPSTFLPARSDDSHTLSTCLGVGFMGAGVLLIPVSLLLAALLAFGQFSTDPTTGGAPATSTGDFLLFLACCPAPVFVLGVGLILLGIFVPRWMLHNQAHPPVKTNKAG